MQNPKGLTFKPEGLFLVGDTHPLATPFVATEGDLTPVEASKHHFGIE